MTSAASRSPMRAFGVATKRLWIGMSARINSSKNSAAFTSSWSSARCFSDGTAARQSPISARAFSMVASVSASAGGGGSRSTSSSLSPSLLPPPPLPPPPLPFRLSEPASTPTAVHLAVAERRVGAMLQQQAHQLRLHPRARVHQGRLPRNVAKVELGAGGDQQPRHLRTARRVGAAAAAAQLLGRARSST